MNVEELVATLGLDVDASSFRQGMQALEGLRASMTLIGGVASAVAGALMFMTRSTAQTAVEMDRAAQRAGTSFEAFQELTFAADQSGVSADTLQHSLVLLSRTAAGAAEGSAEMAYTFRQLGVSIYGANGKIKPTDSLLQDVAARFAAMPDGVRKTALATKAFGRSGAELLPFLSKGGDGIERLREEAHAYGVVLDKDVLEQAKKWERQQKLLGAAVKGLSFAIGGALLKRMGDLTLRIAEWVAANRELISDRVLAFLDGVKAVLQPIVGLVDEVLVKTGAWKYALEALGAAIVALNLPLFGIVAALLAIEDVYGFLNGKESVVEKLFPKDVLDGVREFFHEVHAFWDWLTSGGVGDKLGSMWSDLKVGFSDVFGSANQGASTASSPGGFAWTPSQTAALAARAATVPGAPAAQQPIKLTVHQAVNAAPGQDAKQIADHANAGIADVLQRTYRQAAAAADGG